MFTNLCPDRRMFWLSLSGAVAVLPSLFAPAVSAAARLLSGSSLIGAAFVAAGSASFYYLFLLSF
jgi:hypothetical protein